MKFRIAEQYRLEIHWNSVRYTKEGEASLIECYLDGPVIKEVATMNQEDSIALDFGNQYKVFVQQHYIAYLSWRGVRHTPNKIHLDNVVLTNKFTNSVPKLNGKDFIVVDTRNHEDTKHGYHLTYPAYLINKNSELYNFRR